MVWPVLSHCRHFWDGHNFLVCCQVASVVSDSVRPHGLQPTRLLCPWDSPGKNTGVGCHFLLQCMKGKSESEVAQSCPTLSDPMDCSLPGSSIMGSSTQEYWSGCHCFLRGKPLKDYKWEKKAKFQETKGFQYAYSVPTELSAMMEIFYNLGCRVW